MQDSSIEIHSTDPSQTILKLLFRLYDVDEGSIKIDGQDIRDVTLGSLRKHIGVVPQDPLLFDDLIMANVRFAKLDASDEEVMEAVSDFQINYCTSSIFQRWPTNLSEECLYLSVNDLLTLDQCKSALYPRKDP